jgi:tetratricopeptide (TPR) repeat protein
VQSSAEIDSHHESQNTGARTTRVSAGIDEAAAVSSRPDALLEEATPPIDDPARSSPLRAEVVRLVRDKHYESALALLYQARAETPDDRQLQASIQQIKQFLVGAYAKRLGGLDKVASPVPIAAGRSPDAMLVRRYVDGFATFGDISQTCPLGQLRTLQLLVALYGAAEAPAGPESMAPSQLREIGGPSRSTVEPASEPPPTRPTGVAATLRPAPPLAAAPASWTPIPPTTSSAPPPPSWTPAPTEPETLADRVFRETFALGTAAYVQRRYADAVEAFEECVRLRPRDEGAAVMLRRAQRDLRS